MHKCINVLALLCFASLSGLLKGSNQFKVQVGKSLGARDKQIISLIRFKCQFKAFLVLTKVCDHSNESYLNLSFVWYCVVLGTLQSEKWGTFASIF